MVASTAFISLYSGHILLTVVRVIRPGERVLVLVKMIRFHLLAAYYLTFTGF